MTPIDQTILHDPENGAWGNCMQACIASLLDLPIESVQHFYEDGCDNQTFDKRVRDFLATRGLIEFSMPPESASDIHCTEIYHHLMYGFTVRGVYHAVVARNGAVVHDPHPSKAGLIEDDRVRHAFLVHASTAPTHPSATARNEKD